MEDRNWIILKSIEELAELQEILIKTLTKPKGALEDSRLSYLIEEVGDVQLWITRLQKNLGIEDEVEVRIIAKDKTIMTC